MLNLETILEPFRIFGAALIVLVYAALVTFVVGVAIKTGVRR